MDDAPDVTAWLTRLKAGDPAAAKPLWDRYFTRLVALARARLGSRPRAVANEEDVALSAFASFFRGVEEGRFPRLDDRDDLWQVLFVVTTRKSIDLVRHVSRAKRGGVATFAPPGSATESTPDPLAAVPAVEPSPELAAEVAEACSRLLGRLGDGQLREVAIWKMEGFTNAEIAVRLGKSVPTVERKLATIRTIWERDSP